MAFKQGFLWGGSVSSMQTEGLLPPDGRGASIYDDPSILGWGDWTAAIDMYNRLDSDIELIAELGINCWRTSVSWARVIPEGDGAVNEQGLAFYDRYVDGLIAHGIEPMLCLFHFDTPLALFRDGGWLNRRTVDAFERYGRLLLEHFAGRVKYWMPMNEQNICYTIERAARHADPASPSFEQESNQIFHNQAVASARFFRALRELAPDAAGIGMLQGAPYYPLDGTPEDVLAARKAEYHYQWRLGDVFARGAYNPAYWRRMEAAGTAPVLEPGDLDDLAQGRPDVLGCSYYQSATVSAVHPQGVDNPRLRKSEFGWYIDHTGLRVLLDEMYNRYQMPIYVLESGIGAHEELDENGTVEDDYRIDYTRRQIEAVRAAVEEDGVDVGAYLTWGPIDIPSSHGTMEKRYGFIYVNRTDDDLRDLSRHKKKSFAWYRDVCRSNGERL